LIHDLLVSSNILLESGLVVGRHGEQVRTVQLIALGLDIGLLSMLVVGQEGVDTLDDDVTVGTTVTEGVDTDTLDGQVSREGAGLSDNLDFPVLPVDCLTVSIMNTIKQGLKGLLLGLGLTNPRVGGMMPFSTVKQALMTAERPEAASL
jgi:hypothetical protein